MVTSSWALEKQQGNDIGKDQMHWWIFKKEKDLSALETDTSKVLPAAKKMKDDHSRRGLGQTSVNSPNLKLPGSQASAF
jgi:hypothetical protein